MRRLTEPSGSAVPFNNGLIEHFSLFPTSCHASGSMATLSWPEKPTQVLQCGQQHLHGPEAASSKGAPQLVRLRVACQGLPPPLHLLAM